MKLGASDTKQMPGYAPAQPSEYRRRSQRAKGSRSMGSPHIVRVVWPPTHWRLSGRVKLSVLPLCKFSAGRLVGRKGDLEQGLMRVTAIGMNRYDSGMNHRYEEKGKQLS